jgi:hypothetical protein
VVGGLFDMTGIGDYEAMIWDKTSGMRNLNSSFPEDRLRAAEATGINQKG